MKHSLILVAALFLISCGKGNSNAGVVGEIANTNDVTGIDAEELDSDEGVLTPEEEMDYLTDFAAMGKATTFKFAQTVWKECTDPITGNYYGYKCASSRGISVILKKFVDTHMYKCVNKGLAAQGGGTMADLHIIHAGILGDPNHSPRSMHAENRAVDIKSLQVTLSTGAVKTFVYEGTTNRKFYTAFRSCWGDIVKTYNGCPLYKGQVGLTGSIGWEDSNHQRHMHTSVPYCINGAYGPYYYQK